VNQLNVFDEVLKECCSDPITGFFRDGFCNTNEYDHGLHIVCCLMNDKFLHYSHKQGNDLITPKPEFNFPGLKEGDSWCICALRWKEAYENGCAPKIYLRRTNKKVLQLIDFNTLKEFALDLE